MLVLLLVGVCNILTECQFPNLVFAGVQARNKKIQNIGDLEIMEARHRGIKKLRYQNIRLLIITTNYYNAWYHQCCPHLRSSSGRCLPRAPRLRDEVLVCFLKIIGHAFSYHNCNNHNNDVNSNVVLSQS